MTLNELAQDLKNLKAGAPWPFAKNDLTEWARGYVDAIDDVLELLNEKENKQ